MTKIYIACLAGILFFTACENESSSTVGTYDHEETSASSEKKEDATKEENSGNKNEDAMNATIDTSKSNADSSRRQ